MKYATMGYLQCEEGLLMIEKRVRSGDPNSRFSTPPGGKLEPEEKGLNNPEGRLECVIREVKTETGLTLLDPMLRGIILFDNKDRTFPDWPNPDNFLVYIYSATKYEGKLRGSPEGEPFWNLEPVENLVTNPGDKYLHKWMNDGRKFVGVIKHKGNEIDEENTFVDFL